MRVDVSIFISNSKKNFEEILIFDASVDSLSCYGTCVHFDYVCSLYILSQISSKSYSNSDSNSNGNISTVQKNSHTVYAIRTDWFFISFALSHPFFHILGFFFLIFRCSITFSLSHSFSLSVSLSIHFCVVFCFRFRTLTTLNML